MDYHRIKKSKQKMCVSTDSIYNMMFLFTPLCHISIIERVLFQTLSVYPLILLCMALNSSHKTSNNAIYFYLIVHICICRHIRLPRIKNKYLFFYISFMLKLTEPGQTLLKYLILFIIPFFNWLVTRPILSYIITSTLLHVTIKHVYGFIDIAYTCLWIYIILIYIFNWFLIHRGYIKNASYQ